MGNGYEYALQIFFADLKRRDRVECDKILALIAYVADCGTPRNEQKCRFFAGEKLFELKTRGGVRVMAFWDDNRMIICTHGFLKKQQKTPRRELDRAVAARGEYFAARKRQEIRIEDTAP